MKTNIRVSASRSKGPNGNGSPSMTLPVAISMIGHVVFLALFVISPSLKMDPPPPRSVINVSMVSLKSSDAASSEAKTPATQKETPKKTPEPKKPATPKPKVEKPAVAVPVKKAPAEETTAPKTKTALKKKTFKSTRVVQQAIRQLEKKLADEPDPAKTEEAAAPEALESVLDRLRKKVDQAESDRAESKRTGTGSGSTSGGGASGKINEQVGRRAELIDLYRIEIAFEIQKNWAFNQQLAGGDSSLVSAIVFKVMPGGEIRDIFFTDRSGNTYLDESGYKAIVKSDPVDPHPPGLNLPYVEMGVRFTPQGIR